MDLLLPIPARLSTSLRAAVCTISPISLTHRSVKCRVNRSPKRVRVESNANFNNRNSYNNNGSNSGELNCEDDDIEEEAKGLKNVWEETEFVEVFGIGSRKDALLDFCLASPSLSTALRFWNILVKDSEKVLLQEKVPTKDVSSRIVEVPSAINSCSKAVILIQVPKVKLADKITALQQIVSPFGKTDTASVLWETINYVRFLQEQIQLLSHAYMKSNTICKERYWGGFERKEVDLRSKGLCLVPISFTPQIYHETNNGSDYLIPSYRGCLYR